MANNDSKVVGPSTNLVSVFLFDDHNSQNNTDELPETNEPNANPADYGEGDSSVQDPDAAVQSFCGVSVDDPVRVPTVQWVQPEGVQLTENDLIDSEENPQPQPTLLNAEATYVVNPNDTEIPVFVTGELEPDFVEINICFVAQVRCRRSILLLVILGVTAFAVLSLTSVIIFNLPDQASLDADINLTSSPYSAPSIISLSLSPVFSSTLLPSITITPSNEPSVTLTPTDARVQTIKHILLDAFGDVLLEQESFHNKAFRWLIDEDEYDLEYTDEAQVVQRYGAMLLYFSLHGESWLYDYGYGKGCRDCHVCNWYGFACLPNLRRVGSLILANNNLRGKLPEEIGVIFPELYKIDLSGNEIGGTLPKSLFHLDLIEVIDFNNNNFIGELPHNIEHTSNLRSLTLSDNMLEGSIPPSIGNMTRLIQLRIASNMITGPIPTKLGGLNEIHTLELQQNFLTNTLPSDLPYDSFRTVRLHENSLNGTFPHELLNGQNVMKIELDNNLFTGDVPEMFNIRSRLEEMYLHSNRFNGTIADSWDLLTRVKRLYLHQTDLSGTIPAFFGNLLNLEYLYLFSSRFEGSVPMEIGMLPRLRELRIEENRLSGVMPHEICQMPLDSLIADCENALGGEFCRCCSMCVSFNFGSILPVNKREQSNRKCTYIKKYTRNWPSNCSNIKCTPVHEVPRVTLQIECSQYPACSGFSFSHGVAVGHGCLKRNCADYRLTNKHTHDYWERVC